MRRSSIACALVTVLGLAITALAFAFGPARTVHVWLVAWLAAWAIAIGALTVLFLATLSGAEWIVPMRHVVEGIAASLAVSSLALAPAIAARGDLSLDARTAAVLLMPVVIAEWSMRASRDPERAPESLASASAAGLVVVFAATTVGAFDWIGGLHHGWMSNALGLEVLAGAVTAALGVTGAIVATQQLRGRADGKTSVEHLHTLARAMFVSACAWMYVSFAPFLVVWMSDLPAAVSWYGPRVVGAWWPVALALVVGRFVLPFVILLVDPPRRWAPAVLAVACLFVVTEPLALAWMILPSLSPGRMSVQWTDLGPLACSIALPVGVALVRTRNRPSVSLGDPALARASSYRAR